MIGIELFTLDINFDNIENLNDSIEKIRIILDDFKKKKKIYGYYLMRYNEKRLFLGIKLLFEVSQNKINVLDEIKKKIETIKGYKNIKQMKEEGKIKNNLPLICSISMEFRNKLWKLLKRKPTDEEFIYLSHYLANPLLLSYTDELRIKKEEIKNIEESRK